MFSNAAACAAHGCVAAKTFTNVISFMSGYNLGVLMRALFGAGTPREAAAAWNAFVFVIQAAQAIVVDVVAACDAQIAALVIAVAPDPT